MLTCDEVSVILKSTEKTIRAWCKQGKFTTAQKFGGNEKGGGAWRIREDDPLLSGVSPPNPANPVIPHESKPPEVRTDKVETRTPEADAIKSETLKIQAETAKISAQILLEEAQGRRDKPAKLAEREVALNNKNTEIANREVAVMAKEVDIKARLLDLETKEAGLETRHEEAEDYYAQKVKEGDAMLSSKKHESDVMESTLKQLQKQINDLDEKLLAYPEKLRPLYTELDQLVKVSNQWGTHYYRAAERTGNDGHKRASDKFFDLSDAFKKIREWLGG